MDNLIFMYVYIVISLAKLPDLMSKKQYLSHYSKITVPETTYI